jgi:hypothetical protein
MPETRLGTRRSLQDREGLDLPPLELEPGSLAALLTGTKPRPPADERVPAEDRDDPVVVPAWPLPPDPIASGLDHTVEEVHALRAEVDALRHELHDAVASMHADLAEIRDLHPPTEQIAAIRDELAALRDILVGG